MAQWVPLTIGFDYNIAGHAAGAMGSYLGEEGYGAKSDPEREAVWAVPDLEQYHVEIFVFFILI